jgi:hypothetical protein
MESSGAGAKSGAAATALSSFRAPLAASARDRSQLRTGSSDTMSTSSNASCRSNASGLII